MPALIASLGLCASLLALSPLAPAAEPPAAPAPSAASAASAPPAASAASAAPAASAASAWPAASGGPAPLPAEARGLEQPTSITPEDIGLFLPRLLLTPPRLLLKIVFFPIRHGIRFVERHAVRARVEKVLYNDEHTAAVLPTFQFLSSQGSTLGLTVFHNNLAGHGDSLEASAQLGGLFAQAYELSFSSSRVGGSRLYLDSLTRFEIKPRLLFQGIGDDPSGARPGAPAGPREANEATSYRSQRLLVSQRAGYTIGYPRNMVKLGGAAIFNRRDFGPPSEAAFSVFDSGGKAPIGSVYDTRQLAGFSGGVTTLELDATLLYDTRDTEGRTSSGSYLDAFAGGVPELTPFSYFHYGFDAARFINIYRKTRVLIVRAGIDAVEGDERKIPFTDLPRLGGPTRLRGYRLDRFRDEKAALATLEYQYPIHEALSGALFVDAGRVAPNYPKLFDLSEWRLGVGAGLRLHTSDRMILSFDVAYGDGVRVFVTTTPLRAFYKREQQL